MISNLSIRSLSHGYRYQAELVARNELVLKYGPFVKMLAASLYKRRYDDDDVEFADYFQLGMLGLIEAIDRYNPAKGASFRTFATYRIRGSILNGLEKLTERREQIAYRTRLRKERLESAATTAKNGCTFEEMVDVALGMAICFMLEHTGLVRDSTKSNTLVYDEKELTVLKSRLIKSIESLPERERVIISHHYLKQVDFNHISEMLGVTKGRVSQLHKRALLLLRESLSVGSSIDESL